jgi:DNA-binding response OmpR family regulator
VRVLILENDDSIAGLLAFEFRRRGAEVLAATCCADALALSRDFDAAVIDLGLPVTDGISCAEELRRAGCRADFFAFTAYADEAAHSGESLLNAGFRAVFRKGGAGLEVVDAVMGVWP